MAQGLQVKFLHFNTFRFWFEKKWLILTAIFSAKDKDKNKFQVIIGKHKWCPLSTNENFFANMLSAGLKIAFKMRHLYKYLVNFFNDWWWAKIQFII